MMSITSKPELETCYQEESTDDSELDKPLLEMGEDETPLLVGKMAGHPVDSYYVVYFIFFLQGLGQLFPWNAFITASSFFSTRFQGTPYEHSFENWFSLAYNWSAVVGLLLSFRYAWNLSIKKRVLLPLILICGIFLSITVLVYAPVPGTIFFYVVLCFVVLCGLCQASLQGGMFALASHFPSTYTQAIMAGQGLAGMAVSLSNFISLTFVDSDLTSGGDLTGLEKSAFAYFLFSDIVLLICVISFRWMEHIPFAKHYGRFNNEDPYIRVEDQECATKSNPAAMAKMRTGKLGPSDDVERQDTFDSLRPLGKFMDVQRTIRPLLVSVFLVFFFTLMVFPGLVSMIKYAGTEKDDVMSFGTKLFTPIIFVIFNAMDFLGRTAAGWKKKMSHKKLLMYSVLRIGLLPFFLLCNISVSLTSDSDYGHSLPPVVLNAGPVVLTTALGASNGFLSSLAMMNAPSMVVTRKQEMAGNVMLLGLYLGLAFGSLSSFALVAAICNCNPF